MLFIHTYIYIFNKDKPDVLGNLVSNSPNHSLELFIF